MTELRSGDICVVGSDSYADYREQLLKESEYSPLIDQYCADLGFANNPTDFIKQLQSLLSETAAAVDAGYPDNDQLVIDDSGEPLLKKYPRRDLSPSVAILLDAVEKRFPERNLIDILRNDNYQTLNSTTSFSQISL